MCEYPFQFDSLKNRANTTLGDDEGNRESVLPGVHSAPGGPRSTQALHNSFSVENRPYTRQTPIVRQADRLDENRIVLYKKGK